SADGPLLDRMRHGDAEGFFSEIVCDGNARNVCGVAPIYVTLRLGGDGGKLLRYGQGRIDPDTGSVVSYAALAFPS
ncbi:MAG: AmmeMemoRadiSam system protein B, partial [Planctomycetota bacterium]